MDNFEALCLEIRERVQPIRRQIMGLSHRAKSAHAGSSLSCVEILACLFQLKYSPQPMVDKLILSKGHAAMALYATAHSFGLLESKRLDEYLQNGTELWGHPSFHLKFPFIDWSTGSLGHGLPVATGFAYSAQNLHQNSKGLVAAILTDGECNEGSTWETALFAGHHKLKNLLAVIDYNKIQSFGRVSEVLELEPFANKWKAFGWDVVEVNGHDIEILVREMTSFASSASKPKCILAHTVKGKGILEIENTLESHYLPITSTQLDNYKNEK